MTKDYTSPALGDRTPLKGPDGVQTTGATQSVGEFEFAITNKATEAQQIAAIKIVDYMFSEEEHSTQSMAQPKARDGRKQTRMRRTSTGSLPSTAITTCLNVIQTRL